MFGLDTDTICEILKDCLAKTTADSKSAFVWFTSQRQLQKWFRY